MSVTEGTRDAPLGLPSTSSPPRLDGSVRRTSSVDITPPSYVGRARDLRTAGEQARVLDEAYLHVDVDDQRRLIAVRTDPALPGVDRLVGAKVGSGFRARQRELLPGSEGTLLGLLLDDLPVAALISGYAALRDAARAGRAAQLTPPSVVGMVADRCAGWRSDGSYVTSIKRGRGAPLQDAPRAPDIAAADPDGWHQLPPLAPHAMRRRRLLDVTPGPYGEPSVTAMFRDSYGEPDGTEVVLHEYALTASAAGDPLRLEEIVAVPRVLPAAECPVAADSAGWLSGVAVADARAAVRERFRGIRTCTHLNDLLRALGDVEVVDQMAAH